MDGANVIFGGANIRFGGFDGSAVGFELSLLLIELLFGNDTALGKSFPALGGDVGEMLVGARLRDGVLGASQSRLGLRDCGAGLLHLLIEFGSIHFGEQLSSLNAIADIDVAALADSRRHAH